MNNVIFISDQAKEQVIFLLKKENKNALRISLISGGCSGLLTKYEFSEASEKDHIIDLGCGLVLIDPRSALFLTGATLDFKSELNNYGFRFDNIPNAKRKCGCGESFSV